MNMTDKVRETMRLLFIVTVSVALIVWAWTAIKGDAVNLESLLALIGPQVAALGIGEASNVGKRYTAKADVIQAHAQVQANTLLADEARAGRAGGGVE